MTYSLNKSVKSFCFVCSLNYDNRNKNFFFNTTKHHRLIMISTLKALAANSKEAMLEYIVLNENSALRYGAPTTIWKYVHQKLPHLELTLKEIRNFVEKNVRPRQILAKPPSKTFPRLPYRTWGCGYQIQAHLMFMKWNQKNILTVIDLFSRKGDAEIYASKRANNVQAAMFRILKRMQLKPVIIQTDEGGEFHNEIFKRFCQRVGTRHISVNSEKKAAIVERFNLTVRLKYQIMKSMNKNLVTAQIWHYNNTPNSAIGNMAPADIGYHNSKLLLTKQLKSFAQQRKRAALLVKQYKFQLGDYVRATIERAAGSFKKAADGLFTEEVFEISGRFRKPSDPHINLYKLKDLTGEPLHGVFYEPQIRKIVGYNPNNKQIKKVISKRKRDSVVSLFDYPESHREVVPNKSELLNKRRRRRRRR